MGVSIMPHAAALLHPPRWAAPLNLEQNKPFLLGFVRYFITAETVTNMGEDDLHSVEGS